MTAFTDGLLSTLATKRPSEVDLRVTSDAGVARVPLQWLLENVRDGDEIGWDAEFAFLVREHSDRIDALYSDVAMGGIAVPLQIGTDWRLWDGHHRLCVANLLHLTHVPVILPVVLEGAR